MVTPEYLENKFMPVYDNRREIIMIDDDADADDDEITFSTH
jgi:hypothetical protein